MVNYRNSPSSYGALSARIAATIDAGAAFDSHASALRARAGNRGNGLGSPDAKASRRRTASLAGRAPQTLSHETTPPCVAACVRPQSGRWTRGLSAGVAVERDLRSLSYFISHSLLRGLEPRVAGGHAAPCLGAGGDRRDKFGSIRPDDGR